MSRLQTALVVALTAAVAVGMAIPAGAAVGPTSSTEQVDDNSPGQTVSAAVGQQLSTVLSLTGAEVRSEAADAGFEQRFNQSNATERGEAVADRAVVLSERATELRTEYETLTEAIQAGEIDGVTYAQEVASLAAAASTVETSLDRLTERAATLPAAERRALNVTDADLAAVSEEFGALSGQTAAAILSQFTGTVGGEIEIGTDNGLEIEVENEDGERSTQFERPRDGDGSFELNQSTALANAKDALSEPATGAWVLTSSSADDGVYEFEFEFNGPGEGEAEVAVDGQTGTVFELEESTEAAEDDEDEDEDDERLAIELIEGEPAPGGNVTLLVTGGGQPVSGATVELGDAVVGTTGPDGTVALTLPADEAEIEVTDGEREGELEFEFADDEEDVSLGATADIENGTVTVSVVLGDEPIEGALVTANDAAVGTTGPDGTVSFPLPDDDELDIEVEHGDGEAELEYEFEDEDDEEDEEDEEDEDSEENEEDEDSEENEETEREDEDEEDEEDDDSDEDEEDEDDE